MATRKTAQEELKPAGAAEGVETQKAPAKKKKTAKTKASAKGFSAARKRKLLNKVMENFESKIDTEGLKGTLGDLIRVMQLQDEGAESRPSEIKVEWVEPPKA